MFAIAWYIYEYTRFWFSLSALLGDTLTILIFTLTLLKSKKAFSSPNNPIVFYNCLKNLIISLNFFINLSGKNKIIPEANEIANIIFDGN